MAFKRAKAPVSNLAPVDGNPLERLARAAREFRDACNGVPGDLANEVNPTLVVVARGWAEKLLRLGIEPWEKRRDAGR